MNPWKVQTFEDFLYYCCPECDTKTKEENQLYDHAVEEHQLAKDVLPSKSEFKVEETDKAQTELIETTGIECADCGESFESNVDYKKHYYSVHLTEQNQDPLATKVSQPTVVLKRKAIEIVNCTKHYREKQAHGPRCDK